MVMERSSLRFDEAKGPKLLPRFVVYITLAAGLMVADYRFSLMQPVRAAVMPMLYPVQWLANQPVQLYQYFTDSPSPNPSFWNKTASFWKKMAV